MSNGHNGRVPNGHQSQNQMQNNHSSQSQHQNQHQSQSQSNVSPNTTNTSHSPSNGHSQSHSNQNPQNGSSSDVNALAQQTWNALIKLHDHQTSPEDRQNADHFLCKILPNQMSCWQVFATFLNTKNSPHQVHFFAANMLRSKIQRNLNQVPQQQQKGLHDMLLNALIEFNQKGKEVISYPISCTLPSGGSPYFSLSLRLMCRYADCSTESIYEFTL